MVRDYSGGAISAHRVFTSPPEYLRPFGSKRAKLERGGVRGGLNKRQVRGLNNRQVRGLNNETRNAVNDVRKAVNLFSKMTVNHIRK